MVRSTVHRWFSAPFNGMSQSASQKARNTDSALWPQKPTVNRVLSAQIGFPCFMALPGRVQRFVAHRMPVDVYNAL